MNESARQRSTTGQSLQWDESSSMTSRTTGQSLQWDGSSNMTSRTIVARPELARCQPKSLKRKLSYKLNFHGEERNHANIRSEMIIHRVWNRRENFDLLEDRRERQVKTE